MKSAAVPATTAGASSASCSFLRAAASTDLTQVLGVTIRRGGRGQQRLPFSRLFSFFAAGGTPGPMRGTASLGDDQAASTPVGAREPNSQAPTSAVLGHG